jgi:hypothetical protein
MLLMASSLASPPGEDCSRSAGVVSLYAF